MNENIMSFIDSIDEKQFQKFKNNLKSNVSIKTNVEKVISDTSWIDMVEKSIPYLDNIIRNPRRFIVQEENIVPIEKTKVVTEESIKHLAQNTNLIQDIDEDGMVIPIKLLNVYREESVDLYENRFIKSLVDNLYIFVENKLNESDSKSYAKVNNIVSYHVNDRKNNETLNVSLNIETKLDEEITSKNEERPLEQRIEHIKDVLAAFRGSSFIKNLKGSQPVRSPIRKTNVILKEQNFIKALELWEYLESNSIKPFTTVEKQNIDRTAELKDKFDLALYLQMQALTLDENKEIKEIKRKKSSDLADVIKKLVFEGGMSENEFKKMVNKEFQTVNRLKKKEEGEVRKIFSDFISSYDKKKQKALNLLK